MKAMKLKAEVFVHSHCDTGEPLSIDIFMVDGIVNLCVLNDYVDGYSSDDDCHEFYDLCKETETTNWYDIELSDDGDGAYLSSVNLIGKERG